MPCGQLVEYRLIVALDTRDERTFDVRNTRCPIDRQRRTWRLSRLRILCSRVVMSRAEMTGMWEAALAVVSVDIAAIPDGGKYREQAVGVNY